MKKSRLKMTLKKIMTMPNRRCEVRKKVSVRNVEKT